MISSPRLAGLLLAATISTPVPAAPLPDPAAAFGARESVGHISLSPDGQRVAWLQPGTGRVTALYVAPTTGDAPPVLVTASDGNPYHLRRCNWAAVDRLVCLVSGLTRSRGRLVPFTRLVAIDADGGNFRELHQKEFLWRRWARQFDGDVLDWLDQTGAVLIERWYDLEGLGIDRIDTRTLKSSRMEKPWDDTSTYLTDGQGHVRIRVQVSGKGTTGFLDPVVRYAYRPQGVDGWRPLGTYNLSTTEGLRPLAVDAASNSVYVLKRLDGRLAVYKATLDETLATELAFSHPTVDVDDVVTIGARRRPVGVRYVTDAPEVHYFDPEDDKLVRSLGKALPTLPTIALIDASRDEKQVLVRASSDQDPGRYYVFDRTRGALNEIMLARPELEGATLSPVQSVTYTTADGTKVPAYLTLPPGSDGKNLPGIVMPHGGPAERTEWGFDWLSQFFANRGYAVLQPNFRGSTGYGEEWLLENGFRSWQTAIGDVNDAARWLAREGIAAPGRLAIVGWSYGGYAALQANVLDPGLYRAAIAIAPVTDLAKFKEEYRGFTNYGLAREYIGSGSGLAAGSPALDAGTFKAPVLLFHGELDRAVGVQQSRRMHAALRAAGKPSELVAYPDLEHDLADSTVRADLLRRSERFLAAVMGDVER